jgi:predicted phosphohydrolase
MKVFGPAWENYHEKIKQHWEEIVHPQDIVLIPGDISWAMHLEEALLDLAFIDQLKGTKIMIRGNHDYWWPSLQKLQKLPFKSIHYIHNNALLIKGIGFCGTRLWDSPEFNFSEFINFKDNPRQKEKPPQDNLKIFESELKRLELSISFLDKSAQHKIALVHYPPIGADLKESLCSKIFEQNQIEHVCFGHLHNLKKSLNPYGQARGVTYHFCSADEVNFTPQEILNL